MELMVDAQKGKLPSQREAEEICGQPLCATLNLQGHSTVMDADCVVGLHAGATAESVCFTPSDQNNSVLRKCGAGGDPLRDPILHEHDPNLVMAASAKKYWWSR